MLKKWTLPGVHKYPKTQIWCIFTSLTLFIHKIKEGRKENRSTESWHSWSCLGDSHDFIQYVSFLSLSILFGWKALCKSPQSRLNNSFQQDSDFHYFIRWNADEFSKSILQQKCGNYNTRCRGRTHKQLCSYPIFGGKG